MGRSTDPTNSTQYYQGLQFQDINRNQAPETINDAPPPPPFASNDEHQDLYEPPPESPKKPNKGQQPRSAMQNDQPQAFPPPQDYETPQAFPPPQHETPQAFPPDPHHETPQAFPPPQDSHFHHQANVGMHQQFSQQPQGFHQPPPGVFQQHQQQQQQGFQFQPSPQPAAPFHQSPVVGGVQMGHPAMRPASPFPPPQLPTQPWKTGLFDCMNDPQNAIITACFPCVTFGQIAEIVDSGNTSCGTSGMLYGVIAFCIAMPCIMSCSYRTKLRSRYGLLETPAPDWVVHCFCEWCALCQEYRELKERGVDPAIGWHGNLALQQQKGQFAMAPPMQQRMI